MPYLTSSTQKEKRVMFFFLLYCPKGRPAALRRQQVALSEKYAEEAELGQSLRDEGFAWPVTHLLRYPGHTLTACIESQALHLSTN